MIEHVDNMLRHLLLSEVDELTDEQQVRFQPPDEVWSSHVSGLTVDGHPANALNVYLTEVQENLQLRSNACARASADGFITETSAPRWIDCHYLLTAWSPATATPAVEPTLDEHALLYEVAEALLHNDPLVATDIYSPDPVPSALPDVLADVALPVKLMSPTEAPKYAEFWGTMGANQHWKPGIHLIVPVPVIRMERTAGAIVTTRIVEYRQSGAPSSGEVRIQIGGYVLDATALLADGSPSPVHEAWIVLEDGSGERLQTTRTDEEGRWTLSGLDSESYRIWARAEKHPDVVRDVTVPSPSGEYDLVFT